MARQVVKANVSGVWFTRQITTAAAWNASVRNEIIAAHNLLPYPIGRGISLRIPAKIYTTSNGSYDHSLITTVKQFADTLGIKFSIRVVFGEWTPAYVYDVLGCRSWVNAHGLRVPHVCKTDGSPNNVFNDWAGALWTDIKAQCVLLGVDLYHGSWHSNFWAEPFLDSNSQSPVAGYDAGFVNAKAGFQALWDKLWAIADAQVSIEIASSGTYPGGFMTQPLAHARTVAGDFSPLSFIQENGIPNFHGLGNNFISRMGQMFSQGDHTPAEWLNIRTEFLEGDALDAIEIYTNMVGGVSAYTGPGSTAMKNEMTTYFSTLTDPPPVPTGDGWGSGGWGSMKWGGGPGTGTKFISVPRLAVPLTTFAPSTRYKVTVARLALAVTTFGPNVVTTGAQTLVAPRLAIPITLQSPNVVHASNVLVAPRLEVPITGFGPEVRARVVAPRLAIPIATFGPTLRQLALPRSTAKVNDFALHTCEVDDVPLHGVSVFDRRVHDASL